MKGDERRKERRGEKVMCVKKIPKFLLLLFLGGDLDTHERTNERASERRKEARKEGKIYEEK